MFMDWIYLFRKTRRVMAGVTAVTEESRFTKRKLFTSARKEPLLTVSLTMLTGKSSEPTTAPGKR